MARTIKGINVRIGAETTGLKKALKDVDKQSRSISRELRKVNRGLRFNPDSTELLSQKQDILGKKIQTTSKRLRTLKDAQDDVEKQFRRGDIDKGQYRAFKREIVQTESKLEHFNNELKETNRRSSKLNRSWNKLKDVSSQLRGFMTAAGTAIAAVGTATGVAIKQTADYAKEVRNGARAANASVEDYQNLSYVLKTVGIDADEASELLVEVNRVLGEAKAGDAPMVENLNALGMSVEDLQGMGTYELFVEITDGLKSMEDQSTKTAVAGKLFGEDLSRKLLPALGNTDESIESLVDNAEDLDLALSDEEIESWQDFNEASKEIVGKFQAMKREIATDLLPALEEDLIPYINEKAIPAIKNLTDALQWYFGTSFSFEGGDKLYGQIMSTDNVEELESMLQKYIKLREKAKKVADDEIKTNAEKEVGPWEAAGLRKDAAKEINKYNDIIPALKNRIKELKKEANNINNDTGSGGDSSGGDTGTGEESDLENFVSKLNNDIEKYDTEQKLSEITIAYKREVAKLENEMEDRLITAKRLGADQDTLDKIRNFYNTQMADVIKEAKNNAIDIEKEKQNELALLRKEGEEEELEQLRQEKAKELERARKESPESIDEIRKKYEIKRQQIKDKYDKKEKQSVEKLQNELALIRKEGKEKELEQLDQWYEEQQKKYEGNEKALTALKKLYNKKKLNIEKKYAEKEKETKDKLMENKFALNEISLKEYKKYLQKRLNDYKEFSDEYKKIKKKIDNLEVTPGEVESEYTDQLKKLKKQNEAFGDSFDFVAKKTKLVKDTINRLIETGNTDTQLFKELSALYNNLTSGGGEDSPESLNWMTDAFVDMGLEIEEANKKFNNWKNDLITGLTDAIMKGEDLGDVFANIADQIASTAIKKGIVEPIVTWGLETAGMETAHEGAYISPRGQIESLASYHTGGISGNEPLKPNEKVIKTEEGELILTQDQQKSLINSQNNQGNKTEINISAVDAQSFRDMARRNPGAITEVVGRDILENGKLKNIIDKN